MIQEFKVGNLLYAILISADFKPDEESINFLTPGEFSQQLGVMLRKKGYRVDAHKHNLVDRTVRVTQEILIVRSGRCLIRIYDEISQIQIYEFEVKTGDTVMLCNGAHSIDFLENTFIIEVKQGPYLGDLDKTRFEIKK